jgi:hypothetical protein
VFLSAIEGSFRAYGSPLYQARPAPTIRRAGQFSSPEFQAAGSWLEAAQVKPPLFLSAVSKIVLVFVLIDGVVAGFTFRKRALHDMLVRSFCVYKEP